MEPRDLQREVAELRRQLRRNQVYLTAALAVIGLGMLLSIGLVGFYGLRLGDQIWAVRGDLESLGDDSRSRSKALSLDLARQEREIEAIRESANADLIAIQEAHRKIAAIRNPREDLAALREANEALWNELASQRTELLDVLNDRGEPVADAGAASAAPSNRFQLGETDFFDPRQQPDELKGFIKGDEVVYQATSLPGKPGHLTIELSPADMRPGDPYRLAIKLVNRSNEPLDASGLRLDWSFGGQNTGGAVPLGVGRIDARQSAVLYQMTGHWTPAHEDGPVAVTATLTLNGGQRLANTLRW